MQKILRKRIFRDLKENQFRYLALALLVVFGMYIVIGLVGAADTVIIRTAERAKANRVEDGQFAVFVPLTDKEKAFLEEEGITLEEHFYLDYALTGKSIRPEAGRGAQDAGSAGGVVLRIFSRRKNIDLVQVDSGELPQKNGEILLERRFCEEQGILIGDKITFGDRKYTVSGIGTAPDYEAAFQNFSDSAVDSGRFGIGFVTEEDYRQMRDAPGSISSEEYTYAYRLNGRITHQELKEKLKGLEAGGRGGLPEGLSGLAKSNGRPGPVFPSKLTRFVPAGDNPRIGSAGNDK